ncbi:hypothetical protein PPYR_08815 [Photinus pyralis]|uniref:Ninjurin a n=1 Tax=Photinus pyralis TaxID=7054 RepID=A0A1Y1LRZ4_PHOPY|nr:uncharacterized protein LOC116171741 [Photinus pyralis]KAB0797822.1 hypothetical protein PPYR_08815 [Photinus pyralis]
MSAIPTRNSNVTGSSRSPSPGTHPPITMPVSHANANLLNPESSNLYKNRRISNPADATQRKGSDSAIPLIDIDKPFNPPLANPEIDDTLDDREVVNAPYPGVDDGFFSNGDGTIVLTDRAGDMPEGAGNDNPDGVKRGPMGPMSPNGRDNRNFPDLEFGTIPSDLESIPDINLYQHKKTLAQGMMDLALFSANANQLRYVLESDRHPYFYPGVVLISFSLILQVAIGVGLIWNSRYNVKDAKEICIANKINNFTVIGIFLVTVVNVFISAFGVASNQPVVTVAAATP